MVVHTNKIKDTTIVIDGNVCIRCGIPDGMEEQENIITETIAEGESVENLERKEEDE